MGKKKKFKKDKPYIDKTGENDRSSKDSKDKKKKGLKLECCEKYLKKGEYKRCRRCPCFDMNEEKRTERFKELEIEINSKNSNHK